MFKRTLIIDNDILFAEAVSKSLKKNIDTDINIVYDLEKVVKDILDYDFYVIRYNKVTDTLITKLCDAKKFIVLITAEDTHEVRDKILTYSITDYVTSISIVSAQYVAKIAQKLLNNAKRNILIVDDSSIIRKQVSQLLATQNLQTSECTNAKEALAYLNNLDSLKVDLLITGYKMPIMNGYYFTKELRESFSFEELPVLVLSDTPDKYIISRFLKIGVNDFVSKPFINEEFLGRIANTLLLSDMFKKIKSMAMTDQLTGANNRTYFNETGVKILDISKRSGKPISLAMIDIDNFKRVNDSFGHDIGDQALIHVANICQNNIRGSDIFIRFGGEEFVVLLPNCSAEDATNTMEKVRKAISESHLIVMEDIDLAITVSIGVTSESDTIEKMLKKADTFMYEAKQTGKNKVCSQD